MAGPMASWTVSWPLGESCAPEERKKRKKTNAKDRTTSQSLVDRANDSSESLSVVVSDSLLNDAVT